MTEDDQDNVLTSPSLDDGDYEEPSPAPHRISTHAGAASPTRDGPKSPGRSVGLPWMPARRRYRLGDSFACCALALASFVVDLELPILFVPQHLVPAWIPHGKRKQVGNEICVCVSCVLCVCKTHVLSL